MTPGRPPREPPREALSKSGSRSAVTRLGQRVMPRFVVQHRLLLALVLISSLIGGIAAKLNTRGNLVVAGAVTHVMVDDPDASIIDRTALTQDLATLQARAELYARLLTTTPVLDAVAKRVGVPPSQISGVADLTANVPVQLTQAGSEQHASDLRASRAPYRLELQSEPVEPILAIYTQAPSVDMANRLANSAIQGLHDYLVNLARQQGFPTRELPVLRQLGPPHGAVTGSHGRIVIGGLTFITAFALSFVGLLLLIRRPLRRREEEAPRLPPRTNLTGRALADWPRTTRLLPWSVAGLIAMIWLTPFDKIQLGGAGAPINITLDRIYLPIVVLIWLLAFRAGPGAAPRLRITRVHVAIAAFLGCAFLSVVLDAGYLNHVQELMLAMKKLPLLVSYMSIFVIVASSIRRREVPAFMTYTLVLAVVCAVGVMVEYKFNQNLFDLVARNVFRGPVKLVAGDAGPALDSIGRRWVQGPAVSGLELITMFSCALPIAVTGIMRSKERRHRLLYGLAMVLLLSAMFATNRKSALLAPASVFLTLAYFRRRELLKMVPIGLVMLVILAAVSHGAVHSVISQFTRTDAATVPTVDSRTANYDAVRPDLWTHLLFGRGQGTYAPPTDRIVDSEIILRLVETGVFGLVTFLLIPVSVILLARKTVARRHPMWSPPALCGLAAAVAFIVVATLYSVMIDPHGPDVFLYIAGLTVIVAGPDDVPLAPRRGERESAFGHERSHPRRLPVAAKSALRPG